MPMPLSTKLIPALFRPCLDIDSAMVLAVTLLSSSNAVVTILYQLANEYFLLRIETICEYAHQPIKIERHLSSDNFFGCRLT